MKRNLLISLFAIAASMVFIGCSPKEPESTTGNPKDKPADNAAVSTMKAEDLPHSDKPMKIRVGFSQIGAESAWRTAETTSINDEAKLRGVDLISNDAQQKQENQIKALRSFIAQKVDAIILAPVVEVGWDAVLKEAKKANIPVILVDRGVKVDDDSLYTTLIASDFVEEGRMAAGKLMEAVDKNIPKSETRTRNIVQIEGTTGAAPAIDRAKGFKEVVEKSSNFKIVKSQIGEFTRAKGKEVMEAFLKSGEKIDAVYAHNDDMALGAIQAIKEAGLKPGKDIIVVSIDGVKAAFEALVDGSLAASVECNPLLGPLAFDAIAAVKDGKKLAKKVIVNDKAFDAESAKKEIANRKY